METKLHDLEQLLATPEGAADAARCEEYGRLQAEKADAEQKWEEAMEALEQFGEADIIPPPFSHSPCILFKLHIITT